ncbi:hypothetical protein NMY22_g17659 [Coprinellus aureogranulatus]|nr:hypothetical protein NMY22_g17659 [Coprinellus aureogranulatus]
MYFFALTAGVVGRSEGYRDALRASSRGKDPAEEEGWIAVLRECNTGDSGQVNLCSSPSCLFCDLVCNAIQHARVPGGMTVYSSAAQASEGLGVPEAMRSKVALIFVKLLLCRGQEGSGGDNAADHVAWTGNAQGEPNCQDSS